MKKMMMKMMNAQDSETTSAITIVSAFSCVLDIGINY